MGIRRRRWRGWSGPTAPTSASRGTGPAGSCRDGMRRAGQTPPRTRPGESPASPAETSMNPATGPLVQRAPAPWNGDDGGRIRTPSHPHPFAGPSTGAAPAVGPGAQPESPIPAPGGWNPGAAGGRGRGVAVASRLRAQPARVWHTAGWACRVCPARPRHRTPDVPSTSSKPRNPHIPAVRPRDPVPVIAAVERVLLERGCACAGLAGLVADALLFEDPGEPAMGRGILGSLGDPAAGDLEGGFSSVRAPSAKPAVRKHRAMARRT